MQLMASLEQSQQCSPSPQYQAGKFVFPLPLAHHHCWAGQFVFPLYSQLIIAVQQVGLFLSPTPSSPLLLGRALRFFPLPLGHHCCRAGQFVFPPFPQLTIAVGQGGLFFSPLPLAHNHKGQGTLYFFQLFNKGLICPQLTITVGKDSLLFRLSMLEVRLVKFPDPFPQLCFSLLLGNGCTHKQTVMKTL